MTFFERLDLIITETGKRVGQPSPLFFNVLRRAFGWMFSISALILVLQGIESIHLPPWLVEVNTVFTFVCASSWGMTHLPMKDETKEEKPH